MTREERLSAIKFAARDLHPSVIDKLSRRNLFLRMLDSGLQRMGSPS